ncbi:serine/threonine protein kinase [Bdellovibrio sp. SKB1291214]|uniref:serine/threonine protein kinase n=1 Tax=Bdellovibrio sp. SKB1291214 TaxID=1732569 RepID=UPI000B51C583|nr:serine/threonine-protein kinase [Bdellovibrio sp. SKB1291214]UYL09334.1 serine/threonine protein kinase [Bdellovibrio sp. SKB1291214]
MDTLKKIGPYQIIKRIAEGGMAEVYLGKTEARFGVSKLVAIKTTLQSGNAEQLKEMFFNEIRMSANLNHQNIVKIHDFGEFNDRGYMAMEYVNGVTLRELMNYQREKNEPLSSSFILYIIHQVALGLAYAYQSVDPQTGRPLKLIHRDISPHNILISFEGEVKVIDFGIAVAPKDRDLDNTGGLIKGKIAYMSPEQARGQEVDGASDIFALGIVLWELLANERFYTGTTVKEVKQSILSYDVEKLNKEKMSMRAEELLGIIPIMLHQDAKKRAGDANELARLLGTVLSSLHPDFSALALADYLRDVFSETYKSNLEQIRLAIAEDDKTQVNVMDATAPTAEYGEMDEFELKIAEGSYHTNVIHLEKLSDAKPVYQPPEKVLHNPYAEKPKVQSATITAENINKVSKKPTPKRSQPFGYIMMFAFFFAMVLMSGLSTGKINAIDKKPLEVTHVEVPSLAPLLEQTSPPVADPYRVTPSAANARKPTAGVARKALPKSRNVASAKPAAKSPVANVRSAKKQVFDMSSFKNGMPYPSGSKCLSNCPIKVGAQAD